jgi:hypothetical protein
MRRTHLCGHLNIYKRLIVHASGFNLGLLMRALIGVGKPRRLQGYVAALVAALIAVCDLITNVRNPQRRPSTRIPGTARVDLPTALLWCPKSL